MPRGVFYTFKIAVIHLKWYVLSIIRAIDHILSLHTELTFGAHLFLLSLLYLFTGLNSAHQRDDARSRSMLLLVTDESAIYAHAWATAENIVSD